MFDIDGVAVFDDDGMEFIADGEAVSAAEVFCTGSRAEVEGFGDRQEIFRPIRFDAFDFGAFDRFGDDAEHGQNVAAGDIAAERDP